YNMPQALRLDGPLDAERLERALAELARRHAVLRTSFGIADEQIVQRVSLRVAIALESLPLPA
ncbi:condensation domain-containing protein, partial [Paenibacillus sp. 598K]|uniref:condensation domain-containing protein n=1 Tax=Paenibacillus sp. 598K TaxID=1117987 RepID=UPI0011CFB2C3